jgi:hypothetical protein
VTEGWRKLHNKEFHNLYSSPSIIRMIESRRIRLAGTYILLLGKPEGKRPLSRPRHRWVHTVRMDL